ncbi:UNKNOWN [Stylonychia lemnae]|uniref:Uncharacterized protein n=1 Tax=Stylonychia lemnae TaxID=5949 RepID=A0A078BA23_STYLE|nr:UNKNOWN [Stylonychia lemnae]|eukprot:CDW90122.1 UNKNOWN [Stylonychia lemnae]
MRMHSILDEQINNLNVFKSKPINLQSVNSDDANSPTNNYYNQVRNPKHIPPSATSTGSSNLLGSNGIQSQYNTKPVQSFNTSGQKQAQLESSPFNYKSNFNGKENQAPTQVYEKNGCIDLIKVDQDFDSRWGSLTKNNISSYNSNTQMKQSELMILQTPDSQKMGTSSFGIKNSTVQKRDDDQTQFMQNSIRGILFNDDSRRETLNNVNAFSSANNDDKQGSRLSINAGSSKNALSGDASYQKMQNNLKSLQDKIKNLESKLTNVNDDDSSVMIDEQVNSARQSSVRKNTTINKNKSILKPKKEASQKQLASSRLRASLRNRNASNSSGDSTKRQSIRSVSRASNVAKRNQRSNSKKYDSIKKRKNFINDTQESRYMTNELSASRNKLNQSRSSSMKRSQSFQRSKSRANQNAREGPSFYDSVRHSTNSFLRSASKKRDAARDDTFDVRKLKDDLLMERKKNLELERQFEAYKKANMKKDMNDDKFKQMKKDYKQLLEAFERSEKIRRDQKELIHSLKKELTKLRREAKEKEEEEEEEQEQAVKKGSRQTYQDDEENDEVPVRENKKKKSSTITSKVQALKSQAMKKK